MLCGLPPPPPPTPTLPLQYVFRDLDFKVPYGARCLVVGDNGAGKTSLLRVIGGKHM